MKYFYPLFLSMLILGNSCSKSDGNSVTSTGTGIDETPKQQQISQQPPAAATHTAATIYNPIVRKWELGAFKSLCPGAKDTTIYLNEKGDFVEFRKDDTAFYTYNTTNATGMSHYTILDASTFIMGDTMHIISFDGVRLTTYSKALPGGAERWMTYKICETK